MSAARVRPGRPELPPGGRGFLVAITLLSIVRALGLVGIAGAIADSIAAIAAHDASWSRIGVAAIIGALGAIVRAGATWAITTVAAWASIGTKSKLRRQLAERMLDGESAAADAVFATTGLDGLDDYYRQVIPTAVGAVVVPLIAGLRILSVDWLSAVIIAVTVPLVPLFMALIGLHTRDRVEEASGALARLADHLAELAHGLPVLVGLGRVEEQTSALERIQRDYRMRTQQTLRTAFLSALALELISTISVAVVAVTLGIRLLSGSIGLDAALLALLLAPEVFQALRDVGAGFHASQDGLEALRRVRVMLAAPLPPLLRHRLGGRGEPLELHEVTIRYAGRPDAVVERATLRFEPGRMTALVAPSGAGKSTILEAMAGVLAAGAADGDDAATVTGTVRGIDPERLAYVPQQPRFFGATVREELSIAALGAPGGSEAGLVAALGLRELLDAAPAELSLGEQRRLAVARALLRVAAGASVLLLDEPTAHLDRANADAVRTRLLRLPAGVTTVLVSHEPDTVAIADRVVDLHGAELERGLLVEPGQFVDADALGGGAHPDAAGFDPLAALDTDAFPTLRAPRSQPSAEPGPRGLRALAPILRPAPWRWAAAVLWGVLATGLALSLTAVSAWLIVRAAEMPAIMYLNVAIVGVRFFGIARAAMRYTERLWTHRAIFEATDALRLRLWRAIAARGAGSRRLLEGGTALDYLVTTLDELRDLAPRVVTPAAVGVLTIAGVTVTSALIDPSTALFVLVGLGGTALLAAVLAHAVGRSASLGTVASRALLQRRFSALSTSGTQLRANGLGEAAVASIEEADAALAAHDRRTGSADGVAAALVLLGTALVAVAVPVLRMSDFARFGVGAGASAENVTVVSLLALACAEPLLGLVTAVQRAPSLFAALRTLQPLLRAPSAVHRSGGVVPEAPIRELELERLAARWPGTTDEVFAGVSGRAARGQWLVIEGPSGSGKSTMLSVLMGALPPSAGAVVADDEEVALGEPGWRGLVAWCPQEAHVFDSSIRANLVIGRGRDDAVEDADMLDVLRRVGLGPLLSQLPRGLDSRVGRGGSSLSGGERQRLAVARTLLARSELVLLDEPTAHLDEATAAAMTADLRSATAGRIVVLVSHRAADLRPDDVVVQLAPTARVG